MSSGKWRPFCLSLNLLKVKSQIVGGHAGKEAGESGNSSYLLWDEILFFRNIWMCIWVRSWRLVCLVFWFCYHLIAKPGNKTDTPVFKTQQKTCQSSCLESQIINIKLKKIFKKVPDPPPKLSASGRRTGSNLEHWDTPSLPDSEAFIFSAIPPHWHGTGSWNSSSQIDLHILHCQYCCWWPGNKRSQGISSHGIDLVYLGYSGSHTQQGLTHCGLMTSYGDIDRGQHWLR